MSPLYGSVFCSTKYQQRQRHRTNEVKFPEVMETDWVLLATCQAHNLGCGPSTLQVVANTVVVLSTTLFLVYFLCTKYLVVLFVVLYCTYHLFVCISGYGPLCESRLSAER
jgi:hypothetical protein